MLRLRKLKGAKKMTIEEEIKIIEQQIKAEEKRKKMLEILKKVEIKK